MSRHRYRGAAGHGRVEREEERSRFIADALPVSDRSEALAVVDTRRREFDGASHHVHALRVGISVPEGHWSGDGEPTGTAGKPLMELLNRRDLRQTLLVVTRYFGGRKLGAAGLSRAYRGAAQAALKDAGVCVWRRHRRVRIRAGYAKYGDLGAFLASSRVRVDDEDFGVEVVLSCWLPAGEEGHFREELRRYGAQMSAAKGQRFFPERDGDPR